MSVPETRRRFAVVTDEAMNLRHGTGAQMIRLFENQGLSFFHLYFSLYWGLSSIENSFPLELPKPSMQRGSVFLHRMREKVGQGWWRGNTIDSGRILRLLREKHLKADAAYFVIGSEEKAARSLSLLKYLNCPYVVHVMDLYHDRIKPDEMPHLKALVEGAHKVFAITKPLLDELRKFDCRNPELILIGQVPPQSAAPKPSLNDPLRIAMIGRPYKEGSALLAEAWTLIQANFPGATVNYAGTHFDELPDTLKRHAVNHGQISDSVELSKFLGQQHLAFLCGPMKIDAFASYSYPSRSSDYFMAARPTVACVAPGSAAEAIIQPLVPQGVKITRTPTAIAEAVAFFMTNDATWDAASQATRAFALANFNINTIRARIFSALAEAAEIRVEAAVESLDGGKNKNT